MMHGDRCGPPLFLPACPHRLTTVLSPDVMHLLGRKAPANGNLPPRLAAEVVSDVKHQPDAAPICIAAWWSRGPPATATLDAMASIEDTAALGEPAGRMCRPVGTTPDAFGL